MGLLSISGGPLRPMICLGHTKWRLRKKPNGVTLPFVTCVPRLVLPDWARFPAQSGPLWQPSTSAGNTGRGRTPLSGRFGRRM